MFKNESQLSKIEECRVKSWIEIDFSIWLVNENFDNFFRIFHWKV